MKKSNSISKAKNKNLMLSDIEQSTILGTIYDGGLAIDVAKDLKISLRTFYKYLETNPKFKAEFNKAQEVGIKTLVEKMLQIFDTGQMDLSPNELLFIREKKDFLKWLAPRVSSLFQEKQKIDVKSDSVVKISWESEPKLIDVNAENISAPTPPKD
nr:putative DNA binding protein [uncultured Mediterranean phage uvMED]